MDAVLLMVVGRVAERGLIAVGGILALWFGFRLFALISTERSSAELSGHGFAFKAERIGPGIFFALFGSILLGFSLFSQVTITSDVALLNAAKGRTDLAPEAQKGERRNITIAGFGDADEGEIPVSLKAVNTLSSIAGRQGEGSTALTGLDYQHFKQAVPALHVFQRIYVDAQFGAGAFDSAVAMQKQCAKNTQTCDAFLKNRANATRYSDILDIIGTRLK